MAASASAASATFISLSSDCRRPTTWMGPDLIGLAWWSGGGLPRTGLVLRSGMQGLLFKGSVLWQLCLRVLCAFNGYFEAKTNAGLTIN